MKKVVFFTLTILAMLSMGLVLLHCGNGGPECQSDAECVQEHGAGWICNLLTEKCIECIPNCDAKCCGDDGCGGTCADTCTGDYTCNTTTCQCVIEGCTSNQQCIDQFGANYWCDMVDHTCKCHPDCSGKCCGDDGCGIDCPDICTAPMTCNTTTCTCEGCTGDQDCGTDQCCRNQVCVDKACGTMECGNDPVCDISCGTCDTDETCVNGVCVEPPPGDCPLGQDCIDMTQGDGYYGCIILPNTIPPGNQTDCDPANSIFCDGNYTCFTVDPGTVCIENCGTCPAGLQCFELWTDGPWGCLKPDQSLPDAYPNCDAAACPGNMSCYGLTSGGTACIDNCSVGYSCPTNGETRCLGDTVQTCVNLFWEDGTDCLGTNQICLDGACVTPPGLGEFCEDTGKCAAGLDCIGLVDPPSTHSFCTPQCDCQNQTGCDTGWECLFGSGDPPTTCWCAKLCTTAADCPDAGGGGFACEVLATDGQGNDIYGCMIQ